MYGLEFEGWIVQVDQLNQRVAGRVVRADMRFEFFPDSFGSGEGMVSIPYGKEQGSVCGWQVVFFM